MARKRDAGAIRTASGQKSRSKESLGLAERLTLEAATWKRRQDNPTLNISEARLPEHGSVIEKWHQAWKRTSKRNPDQAHVNMLSQMHKDAAERYHALYIAWMAAIEARNPKSPSDFTTSGGFDGRDPFDDASAARYSRIESEFKAARRAVLESGPFGMMAMETIVIENQEADSLRGDLRLALNRLAVLWKMMAQAA